jgi:hypothetical protein
VNNCPWPNDALSIALEYTTLETVYWLLEKGCPLNNYSIVLSYESGYPDLVQILQQAAQKKGLTVIPQSFINLQSNACIKAAERGDLASLQKLRKMGYSWGVNALSSAVHSNNREMMIWMIDDKCPRDQLACYTAIEQNNFGLLKWLHKKGCPLTVDCIKIACANGELEILIWLHERRNNLDLIFGVENEFSRNFPTGIAAKNGQFAILKWLINNNYPLCEDNINAKFIAEKENQVEIIEYLNDF